MNHSEPVVSIITPIYNRGGYLQETIDSILAMTDKVPYELIIINDGSDDPFTIDKLNELRAKGFKILDKPNGGLASARNAGIRIAKGEYILPVDADDRVRSGILDKPVNILKNNPDIGVVYHNVYCFGEGGEGVWDMGDYSIPRIFYQNVFQPCSMFRKSIWQEVGEFDETKIIMGVDDWDFWLRLGLKGYKMYHLKEVLFDYRTFNSGSLRYYAARENFIPHIMGKHVLPLHQTYSTLYEDKIKLNQTLTEYAQELNYAYSATFKFLIKSLLYKLFGKKSDDKNRAFYKRGFTRIVKD